MVRRNSSPKPKVDVDALCLEHLPWAEGLVAGRCGRDAKEYAGIALFTAASKYDPSTGVSFKSFATMKIPLLVIDEIRRFNGRAGSARFEGNNTMVPIETFDRPEECDPSANISAAEQIDRAHGRVKAIKPEMADSRLNHAIGVSLLVGVDDPSLLAKLLGEKVHEVERRRDAILKSLRST